MKLTHALAGLLLSVPTLAQGLVFLEGRTPTNLDVRVVDEGQIGSGSGTTLLQGIEVMPIEITGRRASQDIDSSLARIETRDGIRRVELPGIGRLLQYRRQGGLFWGYLLARTLGGASVLVELPGTGTTGTTSPFADRIAVSADGAFAVIPQRTGVTLHVCRLDGGTLTGSATTRTITIPGGADATGLMVGSTVGFATANNRIFRFPLASGAAVDLTPTIPSLSPRLKPELAMSGNGDKVVFLYGDTNLTLRLFMLGTTGAAAQLSPPPAKYEEPGYLPEADGNVRLLLNQDGTRLFYVDSGTIGTGHGGDESFLLDTTGALPALQITADQIFMPYIGIHILPSFKNNALVVAIGDTDAMDWFRVELASGGGTVTNLTVTGSSVQPFPGGTLAPTQVTLVGQVALATDATSPSASTLRAIDLATGSSQVLSQDVAAVPTLGSSLFTKPDIYVGGFGDRVYSGLTGNLIGAAPPGLQVSAPLTTPYFGVTGITFAPTWSMVAFYLPTGELLFGPVIQDLEQMVLTPGGGMLISSPTELIYLSLGNPFVFSPIPHLGVRTFLTGAHD